MKSKGSIGILLKYHEISGRFRFVSVSWTPRGAHTPEPKHDRRSRFPQTRSRTQSGRPVRNSPVRSPGPQSV